MLDFGQGGVVGAESFFGIPYKYKVADGSKIAGSIAIGKNTVARTGSVMLGDHSYTGKLGDIEINPANAMTYNDGIYSTTLGAGAYNSGSLAAVTGALSIASGKDTKNTGATIYGSMNSIESATSDSSYSGVASSVLGFANKTQNANAALIWGTGNEVTNSIEKIGIDYNGWNKISVAEAQQKAIEAMQSSKYAGGSVMAIGGGNKADYTTYSELTGVQNKVTGTKAKAAKYDLVNGYQNTVSNASDVTVIGIKNAVTADGNKVIGDNHNVSGKDNVIFGSADQLTETTVNNAVVLGHNAKVTVEGGVALGAGSVADRANAVSVGSTGANRQIINVAAGEVSSTSTDAINGSQLHAVKTELQTSDKHLVGNPASADGYYKPDANGDISLRVEDQNKNGYDVVIKDVASKAELGDVANRVTNVENKVTQIENDVTTIKTDVTTIKTDITTIKTDINNINTRVDNVEALAGKHTTLEKNGTNINVEETVVDGQKNYKVNLNKDITLGDENGNNVSISGTNGTITATGDITTANRINAANGGKLADIDVTGNKLSNGNSSITLDGTNVKVNDKVTVDKDGTISGVAKGDISNTSTDAVNGSQLYDTNTHITNVENQVISNSNRINQLGNRVNKVGAGAAALAALHPMDFDPDDKLTFSAGYGNYGGENAAAIGAYYRPDEKVMFSVAGTVGNGENMVNAGVSFALDRTNHVSNSRTALAREVIDLRGQLAVMGAKMAKMEKAFGMLDETKTKLFPDVPANHWAYEYIAKLAGNGYIEGYPDGNFGGDRLMTRYEFAAMLYRAIEKGAALEEKIIKEFEPELGRIRVDRISGEDGDRDKIERVRVNDTKGERDHYGNKLAK